MNDTTQVMLLLVVAAALGSCGWIGLRISAALARGKRILRAWLGESISLKATIGGWHLTPGASRIRFRRLSKGLWEVLP